jgi:hypothetical protein
MTVQTIKGRRERGGLAAVNVRLDDSSGWQALGGRPHDYDPARVQEIYADALEAWRKNPIAWRTISITSDYVIGERFHISSSNRSLNKFIQDFWSHPKNLMDMRLEAMCDELSRSGDLFVLLFRNPQDGMSYIRLVTKDRIQKIETAENDWETELVYYETQEMGDPRPWVSPNHPQAAEADAVMLHYAINRPAGALLGESDLTTMIPWLQRYSRMLEDRIRLHWAVRAFLWVVTVPANKVAEKAEFYRTPPDAGSIVVKDESEKWEVMTPLLHGADARHDMQGVRAMIDAGSGYPPHWRGDAGDISLATAQAMQGPTERHLLRRQRYFIYILEDILYHAYLRASQIGAARNLPRRAGYDQLFKIHLPDISRFDNESLAKATRDITQGFFTLTAQLQAMPPALAREAIRLAFKFAGEAVSEDLIDEIMSQIQDMPQLPPAMRPPEVQPVPRNEGQDTPQD